MLTCHNSLPHSQPWKTHYRRAPGRTQTNQGSLKRSSTRPWALALSWSIHLSKGSELGTCLKLIFQNPQIPLPSFGCGSKPCKPLVDVKIGELIHPRMTISHRLCTPWPFRLKSAGRKLRQRRLQAERMSQPEPRLEASVKDEASSSASHARRLHAPGLPRPKRWRFLPKHSTKKNNSSLSPQQLIRDVRN